MCIFMQFEHVFSCISLQFGIIFVTLQPKIKQKRALFCSRRHETGLFKHLK